MVPGLLVLLAVIAAGFAIRFMLAAQAENKTKTSWPSTPGEVTSVGYQNVSRSAEGGEFTRLMLHFSYSVAGHAYQGSLYSDTAKNFPALVAKYPAKTAVTVYYNPQIPQHSDLREPLGGNAGWSAATSAIMLFAAAFLLAVFALVAH